MIFRNLPAIITLIASLVALIVTFIYKYNLTKALIIVFATAIVFLILGNIVRAVLNRFLNPDKDEDKDSEPVDGEAATDSNETEDNEQ